jgi:hypothetical protein
MPTRRRTAATGVPDEEPQLRMPLATATEALEQRIAAGAVLHARPVQSEDGIPGPDKLRTCARRWMAWRLPSGTAAK